MSFGAAKHLQLPEFPAPHNKVIVTPTANFYGTSTSIAKLEAKIKRPLVVGSKLFIRLNMVAAPYPIFLAVSGRRGIAPYGFRDGRQSTFEEPAPKRR